VLKLLGLKNQSVIEFLVKYRIFTEGFRYMTVGINLINVVTLIRKGIILFGRLLRWKSLASL
jgi:hypothetical protein